MKRGLLVFVACRVCHAGWYGKKGERCPRCGGLVHVTGIIRTVDLRSR